MAGIKTAGEKKTKKTVSSKSEQKRLLAKNIQGKYSWIPYPSEDFNRDKRREITLEDRA